MYTYKFEVTKVVDGDTIYGNADLGFNIKMYVKLRLARVNTPEIRGEEKEQGLISKAEVKRLCDELGDKVVINTTKKGKYGRWIAEVLIDGVNLSDHLVEAGLAEYKEY